MPILNVLNADGRWGWDIPSWWGEPEGGGRLLSSWPEVRHQFRIASDLLPPGREWEALDPWNVEWADERTPGAIGLGMQATAGDSFGLSQELARIRLAFECGTPQ
jgi:hypothetical protein